MRRAAVAAAIAAVAIAGCGGATAAAGPTHADRLACRTVWRTWGLIKQAGPLAGNIWAPGMPGSALTDSVLTVKGELLVANPNVAKPLASAVRVSAREIMSGTTSPLVALVPAEQACTKLGITAKNAESVGAK